MEFSLEEVARMLGEKDLIIFQQQKMIAELQKQQASKKETPVLMKMTERKDAGA